VLTIASATATSGSYTVGTAANATVSIRDNDPAVVTVAATDATAAEVAANGTANPGLFTLSRTGVLTGTLTVNVSLSGTASNGTDFSAIPTSVTFAAGSATATLPVTVLDDLLAEGTETVVLTIASATATSGSYTVGTAANATVSILDNDPAVVTIEATQRYAMEGSTDSPAIPGQFTLTRKGDSTGTLTVNVSLSGTASNGTDFSTIPTTVTFAAGSSTATLPVTVTDDLLVEEMETVVLTIVPATATSGSYSVGSIENAMVTIWDAESTPYANDKVIVKLRSASSLALTASIPDSTTQRQLFDLRLAAGVKSYKAVDLLGGEIWTLEEGKSAQDIISNFSSSPLIEYIERDSLVNLMNVPNDGLFKHLWGMHNTGQPLLEDFFPELFPGGLNDADIDAVEAWKIQTGNPNLVVAVIDTGVDYTHPDLKDNIWNNTGEIPDNGEDDDGNGYTDDVIGYDFGDYNNDPQDDSFGVIKGHGTHVAGTIAAKGNNELGVIGVAHNVKIMPLKISDDSGNIATSNIVLALHYAVDKGVKILNGSWGRIRSTSRQAIFDCIKRAETKGVLFINSAGNNGANLDVIKDFEDGSYSDLAYPSAFDLPNIISVANTTKDDVFSDDSNYGANTVDLGAPGTLILSTYPGGEYYLNSGTSMAAPHVAGAAALLWSEYPCLTYQQVKSILMNSGDTLPDLVGATVSGKRLNVHKALTSVANISVVASSATAREGNANPGRFTLTRSQTAMGSLTVNVSLSGTATNGTDFSTTPPTTTSVTFQPGSSTATVDVNVTDDLLAEGTETVVLTILPMAANATSGFYCLAGGPTQATVNILDNDPAVVNVRTWVWPTVNETPPFRPFPPLSFSNFAGFRLERNGVFTGKLEVDVNFSGTANAADFNIPSFPGTVTFLPGDSTTSWGRRVFDDKLIEGSEIVVLNIIPKPGSYTVGAAPAATVNIRDNDRAVVKIEPTDATAEEVDAASAANRGVFTLTRTGEATGVLYVYVQLGGTATNGQDYTFGGPITLISGSTNSCFVTFAANSSTATVFVNAINDINVEPTELVSLTIVNRTDYTTGTPSSASVSILDNDPSIVQSDPIINFAASAPSAVQVAGVSRPVSGSTSQPEKNPGTRNSAYSIKQFPGEMNLGLDGSSANMIGFAGDVSRSGILFPQYFL
jgi:subtilisin family serine protease